MKAAVKYILFLLQNFYFVKNGLVKTRENSDNDMARVEKAKLISKKEKAPGEMIKCLGKEL